MLDRVNRYSMDTTLRLVVLETYGRPIRYFESGDDPLLCHYTSYVTGPEKKIEKKIIIGESYIFTVSYCIGSIRDSYWLNRPEARTVSIPLTQMESLLKPGFPEELRAAVLLVAEEELKA